MITPVSWTSFPNGDEMLSYLKAHKLCGASAEVPKLLFYEGIYTHKPVLCEVVGYVDAWTTVISINGQLHCIHPEHLLEMQKGKSALIREYNKRAQNEPMKGYI